MKTLIPVLMAVAMVAGCCCRVSENEAKVVSPDGKNEIRLILDGDDLMYEVLREGVTVVGKSEIGLKVDGAKLLKEGDKMYVNRGTVDGTLETPVYKKASICLKGNVAYADFGEWGVRLVARNDGVAYRFELKKVGQVTIDYEKAEVKIPCGEASVWLNDGYGAGCEETAPRKSVAKDLKTNGDKAKWGKDGCGGAFIYLPMVYTCGGKTVAVTEADVYDYPIWELTREDVDKDEEGVELKGWFMGYPKTTQRVVGWGAGEVVKTGGRWVRVTSTEDYLVKTDGTRTLPWRTFILADSAADLCEADIVMALARPADRAADFSWVKPGKVAWDWWNFFDNGKGCNTKTYERFIDFAQKMGVEYVIFDEGWSEHLNIWKYSKDVDVSHLVEYANKRGVGIILWMAWAQVYGDEEKVAEYFSKMGVKGFKVDFMDRGDAEVARFLEKFAAACAKHKMIIDYHGAYRPNGMHRQYPNIVNYEGIRGLENMKWYDGSYDMMANDVMAFYLRMTAGPMDYTPGAMLNYPVGKYQIDKEGHFPGSVGTRCRQMAMMALYEAPLQMLSDSPTNYEKNMESFKFMAAVPVVWKDTVALAGGTPDTVAACAREAKDGTWYAAGIGVATAQDFVVDTAFLGAGEWKAEIFRDAADSDKIATEYVHETKGVKAGEKMAFHLAPGGGFVVKFTK